MQQKGCSLLEIRFTENTENDYIYSVKKMQKCLHICIKKDEKKIIYAAKTMYMQSVTLCSSLRLQPKQIEIISKSSYRNQFYTSTFYFLDKHMVAIKFKR